MRFFTSDLHFDDTRFDLFYRPFKTLDEQHEVIINNWNSVVKPEDEVYVIGDVAVTDEGLKYVDQLNGTKHLIMGNYDDPRDFKLLQSKFKTISSSAGLVLKNGDYVNLNHYPKEASPREFNLVGHIHSLWKVQRNSINVGVDAWNFLPVSEDQIIFCINAIKKHYDINVFAGEVKANTHIKIVYTGQPIEIIGPSVFLAGPTPRTSTAPPWRADFIRSLLNAGFRGTIISPEHEHYTENYDYDKQIEWEMEGLQKADMIVFWVPRDLKEMPGFTTNIEFGEWMKSGKVVLGYPEWAEKMKYMQYKAEKFNIPVFHDDNMMCKYIVEHL